MKLSAAAITCVCYMLVNLGAAQSRTISTTHMAFIPSGTFTMGTDASRLGQIGKLYAIKHTDVFDGETPAHKVTVSAFYMDKFEVTNRQFAKFLRANHKWRRAEIPQEYDNGKYLSNWQGGHFPKGTGDLPVTNVNWYAAMAYCRAAGKRLPTEAEWEYAARGGLLDTEFPWGNDPVSPELANYDKSGFGKPVKVGSYRPNGYGLFDMAGNVWEFTADEWGRYKSDAATDPLAGANIFASLDFSMIKTRRVIRGGSWGGSPVNLRVAYRDSHPPNGSQPFVGFRCVLER